MIRRSPYPCPGLPCLAREPGSALIRAPRGRTPPIDAARGPGAASHARLGAGLVEDLVESVLVVVAGGALLPGPHRGAGRVAVSGDVSDQAVIEALDERAVPQDAVGVDVLHAPLLSGHGRAVGARLAGVLEELVSRDAVRRQALTAALVDDRPIRGAAEDSAEFERHRPVLVGAAVVVPLNYPGAGRGRAALDVEHQCAVVGAELVVVRGAGVRRAGEHAREREEQESEDGGCQKAGEDASHGALSPPPSRAITERLEVVGKQTGGVQLDGESAGVRP